MQKRPSTTGTLIIEEGLDNRRRLVAAAMLQAVRETRLVDMEARIEGFDGDHQVDRIQAARNPVAQVNQAVAGIAIQGGHDHEPVHRNTVDHLVQTKRPPKGGLSAVRSATIRLHVVCSCAHSPAITPPARPD
jgi:hypothetical protein